MTTAIQRAEAMGLNVIGHMNMTEDAGGGIRHWLPQDMVGRNGKTLIVFRPASQHSGYSIDGWFPSHDGMHGGCHESPHGALAWVQRAMDIRAGRAKDFRA
jgi:hypothetical protein